MQCDIALGSEGSFGDGPYGPIVPWHTEILACISVQHQWRVTGIAQGPSCHQYKVCNETEEAIRFFQQLPADQGLIIYPEEGANLVVFKGICGLDALKNAFAECYSKSPSNSVIVEYDLRAHMCPQRQEMIVEAAKDLAKRLKLLCPECHTPGFYADKLEPGLPCRWCKTPTSQILQRSAICQTCDYQQTEVAEESHADPRYCPQCNP